MVQLRSFSYERICWRVVLHYMHEKDLNCLLTNEIINVIILFEIIRIKGAINYDQDWDKQHKLQGTKAVVNYRWKENGYKAK